MATCPSREIPIPVTVMGSVPSRRFSRYFSVCSIPAALDSLQGRVKRRLEDRIRELCRQLIEADQGSEEFQHISAELRESLTEHISRMRVNLRKYPIAT